MIELSIVLLILSLLVGSLLVGRQIVDRAKIQRIIFEFDYYEKAFHQFYDTYRFVPGNLSEKNCRKYPEFQITPNACTGYLEVGGDSWCVRKTPVNSKLIPVSHRTHCFLMRQMVASGYLDKSLIENELTIPSGGGCGETYKEWSWQTGSNLCISRGDIVRASFDKSVEMNFFGFPNNFGQNTVDLTYAKNVLVAGANTKTNTSAKHEFDNHTFTQILAGHNIIMFTRYLNTVCLETKAIKENPYGAFNAKLTGELDAKIDDGRPGTGKLLGLKGAFAFNKKNGVATTAQEALAVCYDRPANEVDKAIYHTTTDMKYGCNIFKIMEDLK